MTSIYALMKDGAIVYVGCSDNVRRRIRQHLNDQEKDFDSFAVIQRFKSRSKALVFEKILIKTVAMLSDSELINKQHNDLMFPGQSKIKVVSIESFINIF